MRFRHSYNPEFFEDPDRIREVIRKTTRKLSVIKDQFESIAFRGTSGAMVAPAVAALLKKHITLVRKDDEHHADQTVEGALDCNYVIVDDFITSGDTVITIQWRINAASPLSKCVGILEWRYNDLHQKGGTKYQQYFVQFAQQQEPDQAESQKWQPKLLALTN